MDNIKKAYSAVDLISCLKLSDMATLKESRGLKKIDKYAFPSGVECFEYDLSEYDNPKVLSEYGRYRFELDSMRLFLFEDGTCFISTRFVSQEYTAESPALFDHLGKMIKNGIRLTDNSPAIDLIASVIDSLGESEQLIYVPPTRELSKSKIFQRGQSEGFRAYASSLQEDGVSFVYYLIAMSEPRSDEEVTAYPVGETREGHDIIDVTDAMHSISNGMDISDIDPDPTAIKFLSRNLGVSVSSLGIGLVRRDSHVDEDVYERYLVSFIEVLCRKICLSIDADQVRTALMCPSEKDEAIARRTISEADSIRSDMAAYKGSGNKAHSFQSYYLSTIGFENELASATKTANELISAAEKAKKDKDAKRDRNLQLTMNIIAVLTVTSFFKDGSDLLKEVFGIPDSSIFITVILILDAFATIGVLLFLLLYKRK